LLDIPQTGPGALAPGIALLGETMGGYRFDLMVRPTARRLE
jgi:hypothetical protein